MLDSNENHIASIKKDPIYWRYNLKAVSAFITRDNINALLSDNGIQEEIGLLSIDIDGNDYWVWEAITCISPAIVIIEYNSRFGAEKAVTIPYQENFTRIQAHYSMLYYGASLRALYLLGQKKGYVFVGCNSAGNNAFFVRQDLMPDTLKSQTVKEGFVAAQFRLACDEHGQLAYLSTKEEQRILEQLPVISVE